MAITAQQGREQILDDLGIAVELIGFAVACLSEAYEQLDVDSADRLEDQLFRPLQKANGRGKRTRAGFAERVGLPARELGSTSPGASSQGVKAFVDRAVRASHDADRKLAELQDSMLPIEAGDAELRAGLGEVREQLEKVPLAAREFLRVLGR